MSSNIYEDPNFTMNVKYSKGAREDGGDRVERLVDIYESVDTNRHVLTQDGAHTQKHLPAGQRNPFRAAALVLGLLCLLLVVGVTVMSKLYFINILEKDQLKSTHKDLQTRHKDLQTRYNNLSKSLCRETGNQTQGKITGWRFQDSCYYQSTEMKNWTESRRDCERKGAHLVIINSDEEQDFVGDISKCGDYWIGLQSVKHKWQMDWKWTWVDETTPIYTAWKTGVKQTAVKGSTVYIDVGGKWNHTNSGSKRWICEKKIDSD